jgi:1,4-dihydroxy-2-naphthoate octaprenyltransferase
MATPGQWIAGARPRTLPNAIVPVMVGTGVAIGEGGFVWWRAVLALLVALALQIGVNYANDYSDGIRGTDDQRVGPMRLVGSRVAPPRQVLASARTATAGSASWPCSCSSASCRWSARRTCRQSS